MGNNSFGDSNGDNSIPTKISIASPKPTINGKSRSMSIHSKDPQSPYAGLTPQQIWKAKKMERDKLKAQQNGNGQKDKIQSPIQQNVNKEIDKQKQIKENELKQQQIIKEKEEFEERQRLKIQKEAEENEKLRIQKLKNEQLAKEKQQKELEDAKK